MAQPTPSIQAAARPFSPAPGSRTADNASATPAPTFSGQLDQALAEPAGTRQADALPLAGSAEHSPDPASALAANPHTPSPPLPLSAAAASAATATRLPLVSLGPAGTAAATRATARAKPATENGKAAAGSSPTPVSQCSVPQPVQAADPALAPPATLPGSVALPQPNTQPTDMIHPVPTLAAHADTGAAAPAGPPAASLPVAPASTSVLAIPSPQSSRIAVVDQPRSASPAGGKDAEAIDPADPATQAQASPSPASVAKLPAVPPASAPASLNPRTAAAPSQAAAEPRGGRAVVSSQARTSDDPPPAPKPAAALPSADIPPAPAIAAAASTAPVVAGHLSLAPTPFAAPAQAPAASPLPSPASQVADAVTAPVQLTLASPPPSSGGAQTLTIHLQPDELGRVDIRIERSADGPAKIELSVERPDTLLRLMHDQPQLQQALDQAGIAPTGRTIQFSLASDPSTASGFNASGANTSGDGAPGGSGQRSQQGYAGHLSRDPDETDLPITATAWARTGLDITA